MEKAANISEIITRIPELVRKGEYRLINLCCPECNQLALDAPRGRKASVWIEMGSDCVGGSADVEDIKRGMLEILPDIVKSPCGQMVARWKLDRVCAHKHCPYTTLDAQKKRPQTLAPSAYDCESETDEEEDPVSHAGRTLRKTLISGSKPEEADAPLEVDASGSRPGATCHCRHCVQEGGSHGSHYPSQAQLEEMGICLASSAFFEENSRRSGLAKNVSAFQNGADSYIVGKLPALVASREITQEEADKRKRSLLTEMEKMLSTRRPMHMGCHRVTDGKRCVPAAHRAPGQPTQLADLTRSDAHTIDTPLTHRYMLSGMGKFFFPFILTEYDVAGFFQPGHGTGVGGLMIGGSGHPFCGRCCRCQQRKASNAHLSACMACATSHPLPLSRTHKPTDQVQLLH